MRRLTEKLLAIANHFARVVRADGIGMRVVPMSQRIDHALAESVSGSGRDAVK